MPTLTELQKQKLLAEIEKIRQETLLIKNAPLNNIEHDLDKSKLKAEIEKLKEETFQIKKPWYLQTSFLNLLVTILVPIITIIIAYFFGGGKDYFDTQKLKLSIDADKLQDSVKLFQARKDALSIKNYALASFNGKLVEEKSKLLKDTSDLYKTVRLINSELQDITREKARIGNDVVRLQTTNSNLAKQKDFLIKERNILAEDLSLSAFTIPWENYTHQRNFMTIYLFNDLCGIVNADTTSRHDKYIDLIKKYVDTTQNIQMKGVAFLMLYFTTLDKKWRTSFFDIGDEVCKVINTKPENAYPLYNIYWGLYANFRTSYPIYKNRAIDFTTDDRILSISKLISYSKKIREHALEMEAIYYSIAANIETYAEFGIDNKKIIAYLREPANFCYLVSNSKKIDESTNQAGYYTGTIALFGRIAPIAYVCIVANRVTKYLYIDELSLTRGELRTDNILQEAVRTIDKSSVFTHLSNMLSIASWKDWAQKNQQIIQDFYKIPSNCNEMEISKYVGN